MSDFTGRALRERREALGLPLQDVYARIHVPLAYLEALEEGDLSALPVPAYAIGFLNTYCLFLELDPQPFVDRYRLYLHNAAGSGPAEAGDVKTVMTERFFGRFPWLNDVAAWAAVAAVVVLGWVTYSVLTRPLAEDAQQRVQAGTMEVAPPPEFGGYPER